ncbi:hypothetical protein ACFYVL_09400 [Streptomyces sp. NPDC004111]|uniref:hypothetical protein n=1 Tax=Streptomyces sp. NPDC004111 TaxID=3364690 RepID=UPI0036AD9252
MTIRRDPHSAEVLARGGDPEAHSLLQRTGFVPVHRVHDLYHRAPTGLDEDAENALAAQAVARVRTAGYSVDCDDAFDSDRRLPRYPSLGGQVAQLAESLDAATTTEDAAEVLTELTAPHDGILAGLHAVLTATAVFHEGLGAPVDKHIADRLRYLAEEGLAVIRSDLAHTRNDLADRHAPHPGRSTCAEQVPSTEREASAVCACPPPPRPVPAAPPALSGLRR